jgi:hypothetical protein
VTVCEECNRTIECRDGLCFTCRIRTVGFTFNGAHVGRRGWHEGTVMGTKRDIYAGAREQGIDITRA